MVPVFDRRKLRPLILALAIALCAFQLTTWLLDPLIVRATHVGLVLSMLFLWRSSNRALRKNPRPEPAWSFLFDILMIAMSAGAAAYIITNFSYIQDRMPHIDELTAWDLFWGAGLIIAILEATRRVAGLALVIVSGIALLYAFFGHLLPGNMGHLYLAPNQIIESLYLLNDGIWGSSIGASATIIYVFILFGALLEKTNMASVFLELACLVTRNAKGGPAKAAIFGSALFGSVSGSAAANVYATGTFTIPLMKRVGYRPEFSGAVEAVASSGGLIMPPVMGSIAFVMAEYTGISYLSICKAALLPAVLYYLSLFTMIHFEALRHGLGGTPSDLIPELRSIKRKLYYLAPLALLIVLMIAGRSIIFSALLACAAVVALSFLSPETRLTPARFLAAMENAAANLLMIAACCACVGIVIGVVTMTGFGFSFVNLMGSLAQVHIGIFLLVLAGTCVIFGMGLPSLPAYILVATFGAPALVQAGVPVLAAHLFVMYFAISSGITPPVCLVAYAGAAHEDGLHRLQARHRRLHRPLHLHLRARAPAHGRLGHHPAGRVHRRARRRLPRLQYAGMAVHRILARRAGHDVRGRDRARVPRPPHRPHRLRHGQPRLFHPDRTQEAALRRLIRPSFRALARKPSTGLRPTYPEESIMSLLHKAITLSGACAIGLTLAFAAPAAADDAKPINFRAVGGAVLGGTWNVGLTGVGKLVNDRYPGSAINVLQGASVSNPLRLEQNAADVTLTQTFNTVAARDGKAPYKKPLKNVASLANMNDTSRLSIIVSADLPVNTFDELMEKKLPVRLDRGAKGTLHNVVGAMLLAEYGYTYDDITKWGGAHTAVSANDRVGMFQDGTLNAYLTLGPGQQSHIQELVLNAKVKWLPVSDKVLKSVTAKTGQSIGVIPADFYGGAVGRDIPCITDSTVMLVRKNMPDADVYKITKAIVEGFEELHAVQPTWKTLVPEHMADNLALPLHPGAEKYYREAGIIK